MILFLYRAESSFGLQCRISFAGLFVILCVDIVLFGQHFFAGVCSHLETAVSCLKVSEKVCQWDRAAYNDEICMEGIFSLMIS